MSAEQSVAFAASTSPEQHQRVVELVTQGAIPAHVRSKGGMFDSWTLLHGAAKSGAEQLAQLLVQMGAVVDAANSKGDTALRLATSKGHANIVQLLLMAGADPGRMNASGQSAISSITQETPNAAALVEMLQRAVSAPELEQARLAAKQAAEQEAGAAAAAGPAPPAAMPQLDSNPAALALLEKWCVAKRDRDFATSDAIRNELRGMGVDAEEAAKARLSVEQQQAFGLIPRGPGGGGGGGGGGYGAPTLTPEQPVPPPELDAAGVALLEKWCIAKRDRDYFTADSIFLELRNLGVEPESAAKALMSPEQLQQFNIGGARGAGGANGAAPPAVAPTDIDPAGLAVLQKWCEAKRDRDYSTADNLRKELRDLGINAEEAAKALLSAEQQQEFGLISKGAPVASSNDEAIRNAIQMAAMSPDPHSAERYEQLKKLLTEGTVPITARATGGIHDSRTLLHCASSAGTEPLVQLLVQMGAVVDAQAKNGDTALRLAVSKGHTNIAGHLMMAGADPGLTNASGQSAISCITQETPNAGTLVEMMQRALAAPELEQVRLAAKQAAQQEAATRAAVKSTLSANAKSFDFVPGGGGGGGATNEPQIDMYEEKRREFAALGGHLHMAPAPSYNGGGYGGGHGGGYGGRGGNTHSGDWTCPNCGANVYASRSVCFRCQTPKPDNFGRGAPDPQSELAIFGEPKPPKDAANGADSGGSGINFDVYDSIEVQVTGRDPPPPAADFASLNLPEPLMYNLTRAGYTKPTPIQRNGIPGALLGRDLIAAAQTGSGKTSAFLLPTVSRLINAMQHLPQRNRQVATPSALVLSPTRELTLQIYGEACKVCYKSGIRPVVCYGGTPIVEQLRELERGCEILVGTPGRVSDLMERRRLSMAAVAVLILDEADRMLDMGFEPQIRKIVQYEDMPQPPARQTLLYSATFPRAIVQLTRDFGRDYVHVTIGRVGSTTDLIKQSLMYVEEANKPAALMQLLQQFVPPAASSDANKAPLTLIFVETKRTADILVHQLAQMQVRANAIHGDRSQAEREYALTAFREGHTPVLVATDVAARGLDIPNVVHVINYDLPKDIDAYVHRIGRTGRAGKTGQATAFINSTCSRAALEGVATLFREGKLELPDWFAHLLPRATGKGYGGGGRGKGRGGGHYGGGRGGGGHYGGGGGGYGGGGGGGQYGGGGGGYGGGGMMGGGGGGYNGGAPVFYGGAPPPAAYGGGGMPGGGGGMPGNGFSMS